MGFSADACLPIAGLCPLDKFYCHIHRFRTDVRKGRKDGSVGMTIPWDAGEQ